MQKHRRNTRKHTAGGVVIFALLVLLFTAPAAAQITMPTPLPQVVATQQAADNAAAQVGDLQVQRAQTEARLAEINRNIEAQIAAATQAAADAKIAAATQNMVEFGAAIGRLEGVLTQLRDSYAGKDAIISDMAARLDLQAAQHITDTRTIDNLNLQLVQAQRDKQMTLNAYNALAAQRQTDQQNDMVNNAVKLIVALAFLLSVIVLAAYVIQRRRTVVIDTPPADEDVINGEVVSGEQGDSA